MSQSTPQDRIKRVVTKELVDALDAVYPLQLPDPATPDKLLWISVGERRVVEFLKQQLANIGAERLTGKTL